MVWHDIAYMAWHGIAGMAWHNIADMQPQWGILGTLGTLQLQETLYYLPQCEGHLQLLVCLPLAVDLLKPQSVAF